MTLPIIHTQCTQCGFSPLHWKSVSYGARVVVTYICALCKHKFDTEHCVRDSLG
jgi:hypothetical protein